MFIMIELLVLLMLCCHFIKIYRRGNVDKTYKILHALFWGMIFFNSFILERKFFVFDMNNAKWFIYFGLKFSFLIFIICIAKFSYNLGLQILRGSRLKKHLTLVSLVYFAFCMVMLFIYYPGSWKWDEIWILYALDDFVVGTSQHFLTSVLYSWGIMIFGSPVGVIILIDAFISVILGYCATEIKSIYKTNKSMIIFLAPFMLLPPIIDNNMYPLRHSLYSYLCMLLFLMPIIDGIKIRHNMQRDFTVGKTLVYIILVALVSAWRNEGIYYLIFPIILISFFVKFITRKQKMALLICPVMLTLLISTCQQQLSTTWNPDRNTIIITLKLFNHLLENGQLSQQEVDSIDQVINVEQLKAEGVDSVWNGLIRDGEYSRKDFDGYKMIFVKNVVKHPLQLAKIQYPVFKKSNGDITYISEAVYGDINIYDEEYQKTERGSNYIYFLNYPGIKVINNDLREVYKKFVLLLTDTKSGEVGSLHRAVYCCYLPIIMTIIYVLILFIEKKYYFFVFSVFSLGRLPIVYLTSPDPAFMYYYPNYIVGIVAMVLIINELFYRRTSNV